MAPVFLSFGSEDTGKTFTDHLHTAMLQAGFQAFLRCEEEINIAAEYIKKSRISVIVFSRNYASSSKSLEELVVILEQKRTSGHVVLPVFYDVDPSDLRKQKGSFAEAFARHEMEFNVGKVKKWREALRDVADLGGMVLQNQAHGYESKFIQKIIRVIEGKLSRVHLNVSPILVGIDSRVENISLWLQDRSTDISTLVLYGMGGIGKTTIAKFVYNLHFTSFEGSCFLANVRETSEQHNGLVKLQKQLLSDISNRKVKISNVDEGIIKIRDALCCKRILLILDDVDDADQLDAILGMRNWFYPGSKIIITTRNQRLLKPHQVYKLHKVEELYDNEAMQLFSWHAFGQDYPNQCYMGYSMRIVYKCGGLPLALKVLGSSLSGRTLDVWESALEKLEEIPDNQILEKLKISYDTLQDDHDKKLFLHIACFFIGMESEYVQLILDKCDFYTKVGIENLIDACLLTIGEQNMLMMHQLLQEMGRDIVRQESPSDLGQRSRLWHSWDSFVVLREKIGTEKIEGLTLDMWIIQGRNSTMTSHNANNGRKRAGDEFDYNSLSLGQRNPLKRRRYGYLSWYRAFDIKHVDVAGLETDAFIRMQQLRLLQLNHVQLTGDFRFLSKRLTWLCWHGSCLKCISSNFDMENIVALDMRYSHLEHIWKGRKLLSVLRILDLSHSHELLSTPDFSRVSNLEKLILKDCISLVTIHESIGGLDNLILLDLEDCRSLRKLPKTIGMSKCLETLILSGCSNLDHLPEEMKKMKSLKVLRVDGVNANQSFSIHDRGKSWLKPIWSLASKLRKNAPNLLSSVPCSLVSLSLEDCNLSVETFPADFSRLCSLQELKLSRNPISSLPECIRGLPNLQNLYLISCESLKLLMGLPGMERLHVDGCTSLEKVTFLPTSFKIKDVGLTNCNNLLGIQGWVNLQPIKLHEELINILGWFSVKSTESISVNYQDSISLSTRKCPIQALGEFGVFSTFLPAKEVPQCFSQESITGSSISFIVPSLQNQKVRGLNVCSVYAHSNEQQVWSPCPLFIKIHNRTKDRKWVYSPTYLAIPEANQDMVWLSYWEFQSELEDGDEVDVSMVVGEGLQVREFAVKLDCQELEEWNMEDLNMPTLHYMDIVGGNLSAYEVSRDAYFLCRHGFYRDEHFQGEDDWTNTKWFKSLFGESVEFAGLKNWNWLGKYFETGAPIGSNNKDRQWLQGPNSCVFPRF